MTETERGTGEGTEIKGNKSVQSSPVPDLTNPNQSNNPVIAVELQLRVPQTNPIVVAQSGSRNQSRISWG